jgi:hypothetical protein
MINDYWKKSSREEMTVSFDATNLVASGDTISAADVLVTDQSGTDVSATLAPDAAGIDGLTVTQKIEAGTDGQNYLATLQITTAAGDELEDTLNIRIRNDAAEIYNSDRGTLGEYKRLMGITNDDLDDQLNIMIPAVEDFVVNKTNNDFKIASVSYQSNTIAFVESDPPTITDTEEQFLEEFFPSDTRIVVEDSLNNNRHFYCTTAAAGTLTLETGEDVIAEDAGDAFVTITRVRFPKGVKLIIAEMLKYELKRNAYNDSDREVKSEKIGDYSVAYGGTDSGSEYPKSIMSKLMAYNQAGLV